jgi:putative ABC transport system substrate-binding protein
MVTGLFLDQPSLAEMWIALLREAVPRITRLAVVWDPSTTRDQLDSALDAARLMRIEAQMYEARTASEIESVFARMGEPRDLGVVHLGSPGFASVVDIFAAAALHHRVPTISFLRTYAVSGVLITYGPSQERYFPRSLVLADRILRGEKPGTIPIERPSRLELVVNTRTASALGLELPTNLLAQVDEVIE